MEELCQTYTALLVLVNLRIPVEVFLLSCLFPEWKIHRICRMHPRLLIMNAVDPATECPAVEVQFFVQDMDALKDIVDPEATDEDLSNGYDLSPEEVAKICERFAISFDPGLCPVEIHTARPIDRLPYKVHTGRELSLMIDGSKPFSFFAESHPSPGTYKIPEHLFDPYVDKGLFVKRQYCILLEHRNTRYGEVNGVREVLYALKQEAWRIEAFILVRKTAAVSGWNSSIERLIGSLLGYEDWQNEAYIKYLSEHEG